MTTHVIIDHQRADGAQVHPAEITAAGPWIQIDVIGIITIEIKADDVMIIVGDEGHG